MQESKYNMFYKEKLVAENVTIETCTKIFQQYTVEYNSGQNIEFYDPNQLRMEEI